MCLHELTPCTAELYRSVARSLPCVVTGQTCLSIVPCIGPPPYTRDRHRERLYSPVVSPVHASLKKGSVPFCAPFCLRKHETRGRNRAFRDTDTGLISAVFGSTCNLLFSHAFLVTVNLFPYFGEFRVNRRIISNSSPCERVLL